MRKQILAALVAAMSFTAVGCNDNPSSSSPQVELRSMPQVDGPRVVQKPLVEPVAQGVPTAEPDPSVEPLGLSHEDPREVDHLSRASLLRDQGDLPGALAEARRAVFHSPDDLDAIERVELLARLSGDRPLRIRALDRIATLRPEDATPLLQKSRVLLTLKEYGEAIRVGHEAAVRDAQNPEVYQAIGRGHLSLGQLAPAIAMFEKAVSIDPGHGHALNNLGFAYLRANRDEEAVEVLTRAGELLPKVAYVHNNLGVALERVGRNEEAKRAYLEASFLSPKYVKAQLNVARLHTLTDLPAGSSDPEE